MEEFKTREKVMRALADSTRLGNLGLFIGAGFSKAVLRGNPEYKAYSWEELLELCVTENDLLENAENEDEALRQFKEKFKTGSLPEYATQICKQLSIKKGYSYNEAKTIVKRWICKKTTVSLPEIIRASYERYFDAISPDWIVTTNYDTLIENSLVGKAYPISPSGCFKKIKGLIPVYHIHGICSIPESIVITQEDYTELFRPNDYRQARLPFLLKESSVLMIGYGLGDINVQTAVDWTRSVFDQSDSEYESSIIQLLYNSDNPREEPYIDEITNVTVLEIGDLTEFLEDLEKFMQSSKSTYGKKRKKATSIINMVSAQSMSDLDIIIADYINNRDYRRGIIKDLGSLSREFGYVYNSYLPFLSWVFERLTSDAEKPGNFEAYNKKLQIILDNFEIIPIKQMPLAIISLFAKQLTDLGPMINPDGGKKLGKAFDAMDTWEARKKDIPKATISELLRISQTDKAHFGSLKRVLNGLDAE